MNQILITGEEIGKKSKKEKVIKEKKILRINTIVTIFAIFIMILGLCIILNAIYQKIKINEDIVANTKPQLEVIRNDDNNTIEINVKHIRGIQNVAYRWNEDNETTVNANNQKEVKVIVNLLGGRNKLTVKVTEENGQTVLYTNTYTVANIPEIALESVSNGVKVTATSEETIDYVTYKWDDGQEQKINVGEKTYEGIINVPEGEHILDIVVVDIDGNEGTKTQTVVGYTAPTVNISGKVIDGKVMFVIDVEDDIGISNIEIIHNDGIKQTVSVNEKTYHQEIEMTQGENKLSITAYNTNDIETTVKRKFNNQ